MLIFTSCSKKEDRSITSNTNTVIQNNLIETDLYTISISNNIKVEKKLGNMLEFLIDDKVVGGLNVLSYYSDQPEYQLDPNHSLMLSSEKLKKYKYDGAQKKYELYPTAASGDTTKTYQTHLFFTFSDKKAAYDIYFNTPTFSENTIITIVKSFTLK